MKPHGYIGISAAHKRVERAKGRARDHLCSCGKAATGWAYDHKDPDQMISERGNGEPYSGDPEHYWAACTSCHRRYDNATERVTYSARPFI